MPQYSKVRLNAVGIVGSYYAEFSDNFENSKGTGDVTGTALLCNLHRAHTNCNSVW